MPRPERAAVPPPPEVRRAGAGNPGVLPVKPLYGPADRRGDPGEPGRWPYTRGIQATMYTGRLWTMRQYAGFGTAEETNRRFRALLEAGQTGLSTAFDLPTQMGYDSDHPMAAGEVGRAGVAIDTVDDLAALFEGIPLDRVSTSMTINATAGILLAMYIVAGEERGVPRGKLSGTVQNDILKEYIARGTYIYPAEPSLRLIADIFRFVAAERMSFNPISISGYHMREAGATAVQEVAFTLANACEYVARALERGLPIEEFGPRLSFFFAAHNDLFEEAAKFRAARRLWARLARERFDADDQTCKLRFHTQTGGVTLQAQQPLNNVVRVAVQALAAALGGTQSLHTNGYDEALALPSREAATLALRTQQILGFESGLDRTVDPLGGSYYVEALTDRIEAEARELIGQVDALGGAARAIEQGFFQKRIAESAYRLQQAIEAGEVVVVGVNRFTEDAPAAPIALPDFPELEAAQRARVAAARQRRDGRAAEAALAGLEAAARGADPLMPRILDAVRARATLGEISDTLRRVWGEYRP
ncbi:MAG TPA: methylmalonyl-CoA mutase family protein [Gemmatimonadales bacterium]|nr:methylmalonyl-CoA mutase family protein [Gemmatimonadales bacterium]